MFYVLYAFVLCVCILESSATYDNRKQSISMHEPSVYNQAHMRLNKKFTFGIHEMDPEELFKVKKFKSILIR